MLGYVVCALLRTPGLGPRGSSQGARGGPVPLENPDIRPWSLSTVLLQLASPPHSDGPGAEFRADGFRIVSQAQKCQIPDSGRRCGALAQSGEIPCKYPSCSKSFVDSLDLLQHQHTHTGQKASGRVPTCSSTRWPTVVRSPVSPCSVRQGICQQLQPRPAPTDVPGWQWQPLPISLASAQLQPKLQF
ncbi:unnamed protein product [Nyctereutes procyonoides]|uniref:(raccoon dog) hypothetical protein n=1 Tax=Nyctereutes procyonoides TaxID=34880 RepID=A0A811Z691_NYCPR|nr:unnamed protein product [Nyctereutes procyonoides]